MGATFDYTQRAFWGGPWYPYWSLILVTVLGGFFGLDHLYLRSPVTFMLKLLVNILGLGLWWFYDMLQIIGEKDDVMEFGLSAPIVGPLGIGAGMFTDNQPTAATSKSPLRYLGYLALVCLPFGFDFLIAGDTNGAFARFLSSFIIFLWPIGFIWGLVMMFRAFFMPREFFTTGMYRMFPFSMVLDKYGANVLGPKDIGTPEVDAEAAEACGEPSGIWGWITAGFQSIVNLLLPGLIPASQAVGAAVSATAGVATQAAESATQVLKAATEPAKMAASTASSVIQQGPKAVQALPSITSGATGALQAKVDGAIKAAQKGGAISETLDGSSIALFVVLSIVLGGGALLALQRLFDLNPKQLLKKNGQERNDAPPEPRGVRSNASSSSPN